MSGQARNQVLTPRNAFGCSETIDSRLWCMHTRDKSWKRVKRVTRTHFQPFLHVFDSYRVCARVIAHFQSFPRPWLHSRVLVAPISKPDRSFSTHFHLLLSNFICFYLFPTVFTYSINFIYFQTSLLVLDCFYLFFIIKNFIFYFFYNSFSATYSWLCS